MVALRMAGRALAGLPELLVSAALAACLAVVVMQGFIIEPEVQFNVALIGGASLALQACGLGPGGSVRVPARVASFMLAGGLLVFACTNLAASAGGLAAGVVLVVSNSLVLVLSRRPAGAACLFVLTALTCAFIEYAYHAGLEAASIAACVLAAALYMVRVHARSVELSGGGSGGHIGAGALSLAVAATAGAAAVAVWALVVAPLDPGHLTVKLFREYRTYETVEVTNPVELVLVEDRDLTTTTLTDQTATGDIAVQIDGDDPALASVEDFIQDARQQAGKQDMFRLETDDEGVYLYTYELPAYAWLALLAVPPLVVGAAVAVRLAIRRRRRARIAALPSAHQVEHIYVDTSRRLETLGYVRAGGQTPAEFADDARERLASLTWPVEGSDWPAVTRAYERVRYGAQQPTDGELAQCWTFYDALPRCARRAFGRLKYWTRYFWRL